MGGWHFIRGKTGLKLFAGLDLQYHRLSPDDPSSGPRGSNAGFKTGDFEWSVGGGWARDSDRNAGAYDA